MGYKLRVDLDGEEPCAITALIEDGLGKGARSGSDFGDRRATGPINPLEHLGS
jgi:hypothetical protein